MKIGQIITGLLLYTSRLFSEAKSPQDPEKFALASRKIEEITKEFQNHPANNPESLDWFKEEVNQGFTPEQFEVFAKNYLYRTAGTLPSVAETLSYLALRGQYESLPLVAQNAREEGGGIAANGEVEFDYAHMSLCENAFNTLGEKVFNLQPIEVSEINEEELLPETRNFRESQLRSFASKGEPLVGRYAAQESAAPGMLHTFEELFKAYRGYFTEEEYKNMMKYFRAHIPEELELQGVEDRHAGDAMLVAASALYRNLTKAAETGIIEGGKEMLDTQKALWEGMKKRIQELGKTGERVKPKRSNDILESKDDIDIPRTLVSPEGFSQLEKPRSKEI